MKDSEEQVVDISSVRPKYKQVQVKLVDVPCKRCGKGVNETEATCWMCGLDNPAKK